MDLLSIIGFILALIAIFGGTVLKGSGIAALWSGAAFVIVIVGTVAATLLQTPMAVMMRAMNIVRWVFFPPDLGSEAVIEKIIEWSQVARKQGLLGLESNVEMESDPFIAKALQLLVDGSEPDAIQNIMEVEISTREELDLAAAKVFESMGIYAPTMGIIGAVMGLIAVMQNLADPEYLGRGIAVAFVATIYGIASANLFFLPMGGKLKGVVQTQSKVREMIVEGIVSIAQGENPRNIETKLQGFLN
ncbi:flagellar motor protein [Wenzhouxiangella sp. AB-CW3]|uniref:flagellar motor protein n=1 Tax=Wenzhouxiangella sp. AB-CW3 TaxID=2771012 RepID=UPI00168B317D|nr:flagellar motor protein [Wenzhouxiangella sp. AB-CW3]QOC21184.1 flagellar motor protein [Wenzhouxiangella sp. AB-CW3]